MAQHDYNIANQTFPNTRTDINDVLSAIASNNSGDTAPSTTFANQWFYETDTNKLFIRNEDNDAYIHVLTLNQTNDTVSSIGGAATLAGIDDQTSSNDDQLTITDTAVIINEDSDDVDFRVESNGNANKLVVNAGNNLVGINADPDLGSGLHIKNADSGQSAAGGNGDELVLENDGECGLSILSGASSSGNIFFGDSGGSATGIIAYNHSSNFMAFSTNGGNERVRITSAGSVGMGTTSPDSPLHVHVGSAGSVTAFDTTGVTIEDSDNATLNFLSPDANQSRILFGSPTDNVGASIKWGHDSTKFEIKGGTGSSILELGGAQSNQLQITNAGVLSTGAETAPDTGQGGLCLNQGSNDDGIFSLKSSDVAHGMTSLAQTDTWLSLHKDNASSGGVRARICSGQVKSLKIECFATGENTAEATTALSNFAVDGRPKSGTSVQSHDGDANIASFRTGDAAQCIFKGDGEIFSNQTSTVGTFDEYDDAQLIRSYDLTRGEGNKVKGLIASKFDKFVKYNRDDLKDARLIGKDENGNPTNFINLNGFIRLHNGAIWQQYEKHQKLANAMYELAKAAVGEEKANEILEQNEIKLLN